jgi:hypothetical protein
VDNDGIETSGSATAGRLMRWSRVWEGGVREVLREAECEVNDLTEIRAIGRDAVTVFWYRW